MSYQIIKQPDDLYAVFSSVVDDFILIDATPDEIIDIWVQEEKERLTRKVRQIVEDLKAGKKPYFQFTMTWEEAEEKIRAIHKQRLGRKSGE